MVKTIYTFLVTKRDGLVTVQKSCLTQGLQQGWKLHPGFPCYLATAPSSSKCRLFPRLSSSRYLTAPAKGAGTLCFGKSNLSANKHQSQNTTTALTSRLMGGSKSLKIKGLNYLLSFRNHSSGQVHTHSRKACLLLTMPNLPPFLLVSLHSLEVTFLCSKTHC